MAMPAAAISSGTQRCQRRSWWRSDERPQPIMKKQPARYGMALSRPTLPSLPIPALWISVGIQNARVLTASITAKYTATSNQTCGFLRIAENEVIDLRCSSLFNCSRNCCFCCGASQLTVSKLSGRHLSTTSPSRITGTPSITNIHCQPRRPATSWKLSRMPPDNGPPITPAIGTAMANNAVICARRPAGYQRFRNTRMPGKNPASATPSRKRKT
ncbi:hypothetical protein D3C75_859090 [compost metagenome]